MEAKELRIGNLIQLYRNPDDAEKSIQPIKSIYYEDNESIYYAELEDGFHVNTDTGISPIPLTEEWLLKFRFDKIENSEVSFWQKGYLRIYFDALFDSTFNCCMREPSKPQKDNFICSIKNVHQLQNLYFALTGEELKV